VAVPLVVDLVEAVSAVDLEAEVSLVADLAEAGNKLILKILIPYQNDRVFFLYLVKIKKNEVILFAPIDSSDKWNSNCSIREKDRSSKHSLDALLQSIVIKRKMVFAF
jgi:hypothetical protein